MKNLIPTILLITPLACVGQTTLLNDSFSDNDRSVQDLPNTAAIFASQGANTLTESGNELQFYTASGSNRIMLGYFTDTGTSVDLAVGESLSLDFTVRLATGTFNSTNTNQFRFGLLQSSTARFSGDSFGVNNPIGSGITGYQATVGLGVNTQATAGVFERTNTASNNPTINLGNWTLLADRGGNADSDVAVNGVDYDVSFLVTRSALDQVDFQVTLSDGADYDVSYSVSDSENIVSSFDTFAITTNGLTTNSTDLVDNIAFSNLSLTYTTSAIPEPTMGALIGGLGAVAFVIARRKRA